MAVVRKYGIGAAIVGGTLLVVSTLVVLRARAAARRAFALIERPTAEI